MMQLGLILSVVALTIPVYALNDWGNIAEVKERHPDCFRPGSVLKVEHAGADWYTYCGEAEKCFKEETDSELYEEATVQAKMYLFGHFSKDDPAVKVEVAGARKMYQFQDGNFRCVVMGALAKDVKVIPGKKQAPQVSVPQVVSVSPRKPAATGLPKVNAFPKTNEIAKTNSISKTNELKKENELKKTKELDQVGQISDAEKLDLLRARLEANPKDYRIRIRMGRIFAAQGKVRRALNNYNDAARLMILDDSTSDADKVGDLFEIAQYEEANAAYSRALKHYRAVLRMRDKDKSRYANARISFLLLKCDAL